MKKRTAGILLHISSLDAKYGVGTLGKCAYEFVDFMADCGLSVWQVLPLVPTSYGDSPYQACSSTALNYNFIDLEVLTEQGLLKKEEYENVDFGGAYGRVEYDKLFYHRADVLRLAYARFDKQNADFLAFLDKGEYLDFAEFMSIKSHFGNKSWKEWPVEYHQYDSSAVQALLVELKDDILFWQFTQYLFLQQWQALKAYANGKGVSIMGDTPLYVAYDSVEAWKHPELFLFDEDKNPVKVAGCPPDDFSEDGQLWGNPVYDWTYMKKTGYEWWNDRIRRAFELFDILRIDHFRGFDRFYAIPADSKTAKVGEWMDGPHAELFLDKLDLNIVAEDLGIIDDGVRKLMKDTNYPGMKIMEFAFDGHEDNEHKPSSFASSNFVAYTGTHDNMPLIQYIRDFSEKEMEVYVADVKQECAKYDVPVKSEKPEDLVDAVMELAYASIADTVILPMQDLLKQGGESRMNLPSTVSTANWSYRITKAQLSDELKARLTYLTHTYKRV